ncbi:hypothetical protein SRB17_41630 [Streptomyces sp. RB17]|nr:hypothetical protein [Streptomyces sp. RB17]
MSSAVFIFMLLPEGYLRVNNSQLLDLREDTVIHSKWRGH